MPRKVYWDSCAFLGLLNQEPGKANDCRAVWEEARSQKTVIVTSVFTFAEVIRAKCEGKVKPLPAEDDKPIEDLLGQKWVTRLLLDETIAVAARRLVRAHPECKKPSDGIHLASALQFNVDELHTYDGSDLLRLDGKVMRKDGHLLKICRPNVIVPPSDLISLISGQGSIFNQDS